jgi:hypothetical protein
MLAAAAVELRAQARAAELQVRAARVRVEQSREVILPLHERIVAATQLQYNAMQVGAFELLQARRDAVAAGVRHVEFLRDYWLATVERDLLRLGVGGAGTGAALAQARKEEDR